MEEQLAARMAKGDEEAFDALFHLYKNKIFRMAYLISGSYADSEDIVQETFIKCFLYRNKLKEPEHFSRWLYQILTRTAWRFVKKGRREQPVEEIFDGTEADGSMMTADIVITREENEILYRQINQLDLKQKTVVVLYYFNDMSTKEIARVMGCMEGTVKSRLFTARQNLKQSLERKTQKNEEVMAWTKNNLTL